MSRARWSALALVVVAVIAAIWWHARGDHAGEAPSATTRASSSSFARASGGSAVRGGRRIAGDVTFDGAPVAGASVRLAGGARVATSATGEFDLGAQPNASYVVIAEMPGRTGAVEGIDLRDPTSHPDQLHLVLHACDASLHGFVRDSAGGAISNARVAMLAGDELGLATEADATGAYELCVPVGGGTVIAGADGYGRRRDEVNAFGRLRHDFALVPAADVHGRVVRASDRAPVSGATVELSDEGTYATEHRTTSRDDGTFRFDDAGPGRYRIHASADHLASPAPIEIVAEVGASSQDIVCALDPAPTVSGKVVERGGAKPVDGVEVMLVSRNRAFDYGFYHAVSQADGSFVLEHVLAGDYNVRDYALARNPGQVTVAARDVDNVVLEVEPPASIAGRVTKGGKPVDGAKVQLAGESDSTYADATGAYVLRAVVPGTYQMYAESQRDGAFTKGHELVVAAGEHKTGVDLELDLAASISGVVVDQNGAPIGGASLRFSLLRGEDFGNATTADDGTFRARALQGGGDYLYEVTSATGIRFRPAHGKRFAPIKVKDSRSELNGVRVEVLRESLSIAGRVVDTAGGPVADAAIAATPAGMWGAEVSTTTDVQGAFTLRDLPSGTYHLHVRSAHGEEQLDVPAGQSHVVVQLAGVGSIAGKLDGFDAVPDVFAVAEGRSRYLATTSGQPGVLSFEIRNVPVGTYVVYARGKSGVAQARVEVRAGAAANVVLQQRRYGTVIGAVTDERTHAPLVGAYCYARADIDGRGESATTDETGGYRLERAVEGHNSVYCVADAARASGEVAVVGGETRRLDLVSRVRDTPRRGYIGMTVEWQLSDILVASVAPGGPAANAGIQVGDAIVEVDNDKSIARFGERLMDFFETRPIGTQLKVTLERGDAQVTATVTIAPAPP